MTGRVSVTAKRRSEKQEPRKSFSSKYHRQVARRIRDIQWKFMERVAALGTLWFCVWNKMRLPELADEHRAGLLDGMEMLEWIDSHPEWWIKGEWSDERYAMPLQLTATGHAALRERDKYDMEPVVGGLVEPGWSTVPLKHAKSPSATLPDNGTPPGAQTLNDIEQGKG